MDVAAGEDNRKIEVVRMRDTLEVVPVVVPVGYTRELNEGQKGKEE